LTNKKNGLAGPTSKKAKDHQSVSASAPAVSNRVIYILCIVCGLLIGADAFVHKHGPFEIEHVWGFYALCGFVSCVILVITANMLSAVLTKPEDYYDQ